MQHSSQSGALDNTDLKDTWFNPYIEENTRKTPRYEPSVAPDNDKILKSSLYKTHVHEGPASERVRASESRKRNFS